MKKYQDISAHDFVNFANIFKLKNIFSKRSIEGCSKLGCNQIIKYENQKRSQVPFEKYVYEYESDTYIYYVDKNGNIPVDKWHTSKVFQIRLYNNKVLFQEKWHIYDKLDFKDKVSFLKGSHQQNDIKLDNKNIKFTLFDLKGKCNHNNLKTHMEIYKNTNIKPHFCEKKRSKRRSKRKSKRSRSIGKRKRRSRSKKITNRNQVIKDVLIIGSIECSHCSEANKRAKDKKKIYNFNYIFKEYPTIKEAIEEAQKINKKIDAIPAIFVNGKYQINSPF